MKNQKGFTFVEVLMAIAILAIVLIGVSSAYFSAAASRIQSRETAIAMNIARAILEHVRNENLSNPGFTDVFEKFRPGAVIDNPDVDNTNTVTINGKDFTINQLVPRATYPNAEFNIDTNLRFSNLDHRGVNNALTDDQLYNDTQKILTPADGQEFIGTVEFPVDIDDETFLTENPGRISALDDAERDELALDFGYADENGNLQGRDINGDGDTNDDQVDPAELEMLPVRVTITWRSGKGTRTYKLISILKKIPESN